MISLSYKNYFLYSYLAKKFRRFKKYVYLSTGFYSEFRVEIQVDYEWMGSDYGGFFVSTAVRNRELLVYSFGVGEDITFDLMVNSRFNCEVHLFDPTPRVVNFIREQSLPTNFCFHNFGIGAEDSVVNFYLPKNESNVSGSIIHHVNVDDDNYLPVTLRSFKSICNEKNHKYIDILKMDIEGAEYEVLDSILNSGVIIDQILIEFHSRFFESGKEKTRKALNFLKLNGYGIFAVSDSFEEISLIRRK